ncbi:hypothetical protein V490_01599 [Pseudogymnoascus sp. VKM F-3557]|nr:hypothetical protein V490_01599 [Pseudogymnoascus sp. VKM F-3557]
MRLGSRGLVGGRVCSGVVVGAHTTGFGALWRFYLWLSGLAVLGVVSDLTCGKCACGWHEGDEEGFELWAL